MPRLSQISPQAFRKYFLLRQNGIAGLKWWMLFFSGLILASIMGLVGNFTGSHPYIFTTLSIIMNVLLPYIAFLVVPLLTLMALVHLTVLFHTRENHYRPAVAVATLVLTALAMLATYATVLGLVYGAGIPIVGLIPLWYSGVRVLPAASLIASGMAAGVALATTLLSLAGAELQRVLTPWLRSRLPFRAMHQRQPAPSHEFSDTQSLAPTAALANYGAVATATAERPTAVTTTAQTQNPPAGRDTNPSSPPATPAIIDSSATPLLAQP